MPSISHITWTRAATQPLHSAARVPEDQAALEALHADGFENFQLAAETLDVMMAAAMRQVLAESGFDPGDIDAVVFCTESFWDTEIAQHSQTHPGYRRIRDALLVSMHALGLGHAYPYGSWLSSCANLGPALSLAKSLVTSGQHERVLLVLGDKQHREAGPLMTNGAAVYSDIAAACIVQGEPSQIELHDVVLHCSPRLASPEMDGAAFVLETNRAVRALSRKFRLRTGRSCNGFATVITNNYHLHSQKIILDALGVPAASVRRDTRSILGHGHATDTLLTLEELRRGGWEGEALLLMTGLHAWNLAVVHVAPSGLQVLPGAPT